jgi:hypothetical protein
MAKRRTDNTMAKRRTDNTMAKRRTDNTMAKRRTDNTMAKRTKNDLQNIIQKTLDRATPSPIVFVFSLFISLQHSIKRLQLECHIL